MSLVYDNSPSPPYDSRACRLTSIVFEKLVKNETLTKGDKSPVTIGDFASQAVISTMLQHVFPDDPIVGEANASNRFRSSAHCRERIVDLANEALTDNKGWGIGPGQQRSASDVIDRGNHPGGRTGRMRTIDPIDGTKGLLRGEQCAVYLALIVDVKVGVIGCPTYPLLSQIQKSGD
ncbi:hypothetical protein JOM56_012805 [Amanita muscaria]